MPLEVEHRTQKAIDGVHMRLDRHDARIQTVEQNMHNLDKIVTVAINKLDHMISLVTSISTTIRNSVIGVIVGAILWVIAQMGGIV